MTNDPSEHRTAILRPSELASHDRGGGARTTPLVTPAIGAQAFINGITSFAPGAEIPFHSHNCEESVMLLLGEAVLEIDGEPEIRLRPLDTTWIPPNVSHRFRNLSASEPMKIFWIYARVDATRTITKTGQTNFVVAERSK
jgi:quercetin dioxygenase-like cupin family protein